MTKPRLREPMRFTRGGRAYIITATYAANDDGFLGLCDGRVVARAADCAEVARALIRQQVSQHRHIWTPG